VRLGVAAAVVGGELVRGDVEIEGRRIARVGLERRGRGTALPGLVDLQVNGFAGVDFLSADGAELRRAAQALLERGVTAFQPTLITAAEETLVAALGELRALEGGSPQLVGVHLEGPFLSPERLGAHDPRDRRDPDLALLRRLLAAGPVSQVTLAPELPGALELVDELVARGVVVSCGHSDATAAQAYAAFDRGCRTITHLFNAMRPFGHRDPGLAGAALARDDVVVQAIVDGHHLAPETVVTAWRAARGRFALVSDAVAAAGMGDGEHHLGARTVVLRDGAVRLPDGRLAGTALTLLDAVRNLHALGVPLAEAAAAGSSVPARLAGRPEGGSLDPGAAADVLVLDDDLTLARVLVGGRERFAG
jgi:N-acetylglucosamine-6-phosphate deacetylase